MIIRLGVREIRMPRRLVADLGIDKGALPMAGTLLRRFWALGIAVLAWAAYPTPAWSCPFCSMQGQTLIGDVNQASMVLYGTFANAKLDAGGDGQGATELHIAAVIQK